MESMTPKLGLRAPAISVSLRGSLQLSQTPAGGLYRAPLGHHAPREYLQRQQAAFPRHGNNFLVTWPPESESPSVSMERQSFRNHLGSLCPFVCQCQVRAPVCLWAQLLPQTPFSPLSSACRSRLSSYVLPAGPCHRYLAVVQTLGFPLASQILH